ncbi:hybrid sensor histidine kinase/response regulator [Flavobacterium aquariorum]|uniref:Sensory/regulatory protein RpfC n=1 Tax=Flavobacterium aquariorum TaxID=2217670 RepID=A0A2W7TWQ2_9FLAO|nr:PAS domain-containing protein [Flavobacterium aquariorum]PZX94741.1 hybrid sensor histidine kinase/response regulator [Flavobacterium aquariorum]
MEKTKKEFTYDELLQKVEAQELLIKKLNDEKFAITNFEYFVKESPDLVCIADTNAYYKIVNDEFPKILGYSKEELLSRPFLEFIHPDDLDKTLEEVQNLTQNNPTVDFENRYIKKNGESICLQWRANLHTANNLIYAIARDVTEIRKTQEKLLSSEKSLNEAQKIAKIESWDFNLVTQELNWSNELYEIFEIENFPGDPQLYAKYLSCFVSEDAEDLNKNVYNTISNKVPYEMEHRIILKDQKTKWVFCTGVPIMDKNNNVVALKGVVQDITQKKQIDDTIKAKEKAEAANKAKSDFLANMSHEIRTPLNGIVGFTDLLLKTKFDNDQLEYLKTVNESANTLMEIINNILDFSKIESGKLELSTEEIDIIQLSNQIVNLFKYEANFKKIDLLLDIDPNVPKCIKGDSFRLKQILVNLLSNSMKFTFSGHIKLKVAQVEEDKTTSKIKFSVIDTGIGIKDYNQKKIFQSFVQADNTTTRKYGGTGLGLAISSQLLALKNSELELISAYGAGSEFFFTVAFEKIFCEKNDLSVKENLGSNMTSHLSNSLTNFKVLIAEDNKINMLLAKTLVRKIIKNCDLIEAANGYDAVVLAEENLPDLILMDIQMPIQNGYDATLEIRKSESTKHIPIIALTAGVLNGEKEKCMEHGMSDYITKPIIQNQLEKVLLKWLKN